MRIAPLRWGGKKKKEKRKKEKQKQKRKKAKEFLISRKAPPLSRTSVPTTEAEDEVEGGLLLDVVVSEGVAVLQLLARKDQTLLVRGDALLVLDLGLHSVDAVGGVNLEGDGLASEGLHENLHGVVLLVWEKKKGKEEREKKREGW